MRAHTQERRQCARDIGLHLPRVRRKHPHVCLCRAQPRLQLLVQHCTHRSFVKVLHVAHIVPASKRSVIVTVTLAEILKTLRLVTVAVVTKEIPDALRLHDM